MVLAFKKEHQILLVLDIKIINQKMLSRINFWPWRLGQNAGKITFLDFTTTCDIREWKWFVELVLFLLNPLDGHFENFVIKTSLTELYWILCLVCYYNIFTGKTFSIILNGKTLLYSRLSWIFQRQHRDKNNSLRFHLAASEEQSNQARE